MTIGAAVLLTPGAAGPPDSGVILVIPPPAVTAAGMPLAMTGCVCQVINSLTGVPYPLVVSTGGSAAVRVSGKALLRVGDLITLPGAVLSIIGPPAATFVVDQTP
ncbi:hypothetical protein [Gemmata massiliana]|uniref:hypothetical protein n=1 Tax=Gemmata massiliana TaxID=1210884 RepID=UPI0018D5BAAF|nr:hypothetical protein [Gemmata massiliana]